MSKFWKRMEIKHNLKIEDGLTKQMLIGYMIEYLIEIKASFQIHWKIKYFISVYDYLEKIIERETNNG